MLRFQHSEYLLALALLPLLLAAYLLLLYWRQARLRKLGEPRLIREQLVGFIPGRHTLKFILLFTALGAAIVGWANLQAGGKAEQVQRKGVDVLIALDVSRSMLAADVQPDRLTRAKQLIERMLDKLRNDRVGLVVFAGRAYLQVPLTIDHATLRMMLQHVQPDLIPSQGTVIGDAIDRSLQSFSQKERKYKSLVVISDGEDHDAHAGEMARKAVDAGVVIHTVGIGSPQGSTLPDPDTRSVKLDDRGNPVISKLNEEELRAIAAAGHGTYTLLSNAEAAAAKLAAEIDGMEQKNLGTVTYADYKSYFQYFLLPAFLLLVIEWLIPGGRFPNKLKKA